MKCYFCGYRYDEASVGFYGGGLEGQGDPALSFVGGPLDGLIPDEKTAKCPVYIAVQTVAGNIVGKFSHFYVKSQAQSGRVHFGYGGARAWIPGPGDAPKPATTLEAHMAASVVRGCK